MKRGLRWIFRVVAAVFVLVTAVLLVRHFFLKHDVDAAKREKAAATCRAVRIVTAYIALAENPTAHRALLLGEDAANYREFLERAGVGCETLVGDGVYDLVLHSGREEPDRREIFRRLGPAGVYVRCVDARRLDASAFRKILAANPDKAACVRLWMPGVQDWLVVERRDAAKPSVAALMERFLGEAGSKDLAEAECDSVPWLFASYVGTRGEVMPAFRSDLKGTVLAPWFVTREVPSFDGFDTDDLDADIRRKTLADMRSAQIVRRVILEGDIASAAGDGAKATEAWARAALRNPHDPMLLDRLVRLRVNAEVFEQMGRLTHAVQCYETMLRIRPEDKAAKRRLAVLHVRLARP